MNSKGKHKNGKLRSLPVTNGFSAWEIHEKQGLEKALALHRGNITNTAYAMGLARNTILRKLRHFDIDAAAMRKRAKAEAEKG